MGGLSDDRRERLAAALRENLKRRKARVRALKENSGLAQGITVGEGAALQKSRPNAAKKARLA